MNEKDEKDGKPPTQTANVAASPQAPLSPSGDIPPNAPFDYEQKAHSPLRTNLGGEGGDGYPVEFLEMVSGYGFLVLRNYLSEKAPEAALLIDGMQSLAIGIPMVKAGQAHSGTMLVIADGLALVSRQVVELGGEWRFEME